MTQKQKTVLKVAAKGVIVNDHGQVLIVREAPTYQDGTNIGRYHLPGGRLEDDESYDDGLRREVREETGLEVEPQYPLFVGEWRPLIKGVPHHIVAIFSVCSPTTTTVHLSDEHDKFEWIDPAQRRDYDILTPDCDVVDAFAAASRS